MPEPDNNTTPQPAPQPAPGGAGPSGGTGPSGAPDYGFLRATLGDELYAQFVQRMSTATGITLANVAGGAYVPKADHDTALGGMQARIDKLTGDVAKLTGDLALRDKEIADGKKRALALDALRQEGARNPELVLRSVSLDRITEKDGKLTGLTEQIEPLKKSDPYLFDTSGSPRGGMPASRGHGVSGTSGAPGPAGKIVSAEEINRTMNEAIRAAAGYGA